MVCFRLIQTLELYFNRLNKGSDGLLTVTPQELKNYAKAGMSSVVTEYVPLAIENLICKTIYNT